MIDGSKPGASSLSRTSGPREGGHHVGFEPRAICACVRAVSLLAVFIFSVPAAAQSRISPHEQTSGLIDGARITVSYGRPSMRGRTIFGALVPFDRVWCPGADEATVLDSDKPIQLETLTVPAGPHTIWMLPSANQWTLIVSKEPSGFHTQYHPEADLGRVTLRKSPINPTVEQLTFEIAPNRSGPGGSLSMRWETTSVWTSLTIGR
jgi:hypothetical protein